MATKCTGQPLSPDKLLSLFEAHGVECDVDEDGTVWAKDEWKNHLDGSMMYRWVDVTEWDRAQVMHWMGY